MSKNNIIIALVVLVLIGTIWGSVQDKKSDGLERQLAAMKEQSQTAQPVATEGHEATAATDDACVAKVAALKAENKSLQKKAASLKRNASSYKSELAGLKKDHENELAGLKKELVEAAKAAEALKVLQAQRDQRASAITKLEEQVAAAQAELAEKATALAAAEEVASSFEAKQGNLASSVDAYSVKTQELALALESAELRIASLEKALEERTRLLVDNANELARTKLNMNVLLSRIAGQNNSLAILEETRVALEQELANKFLIVEELQHQLSAQVVVDEVVVETTEEPAPAQH
jgi:chromosome segregation ATPase